MDALAEFVAMFQKMAPEEKAEYDKVLKPELEAVWSPTPGPQTQALHSKADLLLYGGAAGGGKTEVILGLALTQHQRSVVFRRAYVDLRGVEERLLEIRKTRAGYNASDMVLKTEDGRLIEFGALEKPGAEMSWQGRPHDLICVGRGTPVMMADGSFLPVQSLRPGDNVATLEGPRRIVRTFPVRHKEAVEVSVYNEQGEVIATQVQSDNHSLLGISASAFRDRSSSSRLSSSSSPTQFLASRTAVLSSDTTYVPRPCIPEGQHQGRLHSGGRSQSHPRSAHPSALGSFVSLAREYLDTSCAGIGARLQGALQHLELIAQPARLEPAGAWVGVARDTPRSAFSCGAGDGPRTSSPEDLMDHYSDGSRRDDGRTPLSWGHCAGLEAGRLSLLRSIDAGRPTPTCSDVGGLAQTRIRNHHARPYIHPYTRGARYTTAALSEHAFSYRSLGVQELYDIQVDEVCHYITGGGFINKNCFDEGAQLAESKVRFVMGWLRSATPGQRTRVVIASNPPMGAEGAWLVTWFAPWLDPLFPKPAANGELRWCITLADGTIRWVEGPGQWVVVGDDESEATPDDIDAGVALEATSRTFVPARLDDNPYLRGTGYRAKLQGLPEPIRSQLLKGDFLAGKEDDAAQVIPSAWVKAAQDRWSKGKPPHTKMCALGVDVAGGGPDDMVLAPLFANWFGELVRRNGVNTKDGAKTGSLIIETVRDGANINIDMTGGWGGGAVTHLTSAAGIERRRINEVVFSERSNGRTKDGTFDFFNKRTELWWTMREALDPESGEEIALPPGARLAAQLASPTWKLRGSAILIEAKEEIRKRLGSSTDDADAVILAWHRRERIVSRPRQKTPVGIA